MLTIFLAILIAAFISFVLLVYADSDVSIFSGIGGVIGILLAISSGILAIVYAFAGWGYIASGYKTSIINREYQTNYTREEVFWASDVIETIRELDRKRVELNGDIMREQSDN